MDVEMEEESQPLILSGGTDIFEITDFTVITDSEQFIVSVENVLHEWNLSGASPNGVKRPISRLFPADFLQRCNWSHDSKPVNYPPNREFLLTHVWPDAPDGLSETVADEQSESEHLAAGIADLLLPESNFYPWSIITQQFGVFEYILLSPVKEEKDAIFTEDDLQMVQSGVEVAFANSECSLPVFIQFGTPDRIFFVGSLQNGNVKTTFETIHTHCGFTKHKCLSGLAELFRERLLDSAAQPLDITVAIQLEYIIRNDFDYDVELNPDAYHIKDITRLPFGTNRDLVKEFRLLTAWPGLKQEAITDTVNYSDLDPYAAPRWRATATFHKGIQGFLYRSLTKCKEIIRSEDATTITDILGEDVHHKKAAQAFGSVLDHGSNMRLNIVGYALPLDNQTVKDWVGKIFEVTETKLEKSLSAPYAEFLQKCEDNLRSARSIPRNTFVDKLIRVLLNCILMKDNQKEQIAAVCQIWKSFVESLRVYWDENQDLPSLKNVEVPDLSKCLLYQKIQMIQCCIESRKKRYELYDATKNFATRDDEFYDASEEFMDADDGSSPILEPEGRLHPVEGCNLLNYPDKPLYVPITQDRSPMTEDMLEEHAEFLASIPGEDRVKAQLDVLLSDMQAFKAANPGCCLEDFVRWHSPRDFVDDDLNGSGHLSERMSMDDNVWRKTWDSARPIAVTHQARLFNESKEAEQIFHFFSNIKVFDLFKLIMPGALVTAVYRLLDEAEECYSLIQNDFKSMVHQIVRYTQRQNIDDCLEALNLLCKVEARIAEYSSLKSKFELKESDFTNDDSDEENDSKYVADGSTLKAFVTELMSGVAPTQAFSNASPELIATPVPILGAPNGSLAMSVRRLLNNDARVELDAAEHDAGISDSLELKFPPITRKHYVLRCTAPRDKGSPRSMPQRMAAFIDGDVFRVCLSLTTDHTFS
uniref:Rab3 GTPase-activating protein catalytic subunit n=1 Tax=Panagrolaimus sp. JU765 TaxID=591449 RepID=A0AC34QV35_9BILA